MTTPRHGDRPFEIGHIDHTLLDIELVCSHTGRNLGRPWGTFLSDAFSRRLLAVTVTFDPPSYRACMMVLRECVQRHGRLPQIIVVDGGREFESVYFETLLARYECSKKTRPGAKPRFGSVCERLFGTTNRVLYTTCWEIHKSLAMFARSPNQYRLRSKPVGRWASSTLDYASGHMRSTTRSSIRLLGQSPKEAFGMGMAQGGKRLQRLIPYDEAFRMLSLPTTRKGTAKVMPHMGVKINGLCYWSDVFLDPETEKTQVPVRYDPFGAGVAYAFTKGTGCIVSPSTMPSLQDILSEEIQLATAELRKRNQLHGQQFTITARKLADFLTSLEAEEVLLEQRLRDTEARGMLTPKEQPLPIRTAGLSGTESHFTASPGQESQAKDEMLDVYEDF